MFLQMLTRQQPAALLPGPVCSASLLSLFSSHPALSVRPSVLAVLLPPGRLGSEERRRGAVLCAAGTVCLCGSPAVCVDSALPRSVSLPVVLSRSASLRVVLSCSASLRVVLSSSRSVSPYLALPCSVPPHLVRPCAVSLCLAPSRPGSLVLSVSFRLAPLLSADLGWVMAAGCPGLGGHCRPAALGHYRAVL